MRSSQNSILLGSSLSSSAAQRFSQICHETLKDGIADAPLEAPQRLLTRLALGDLLAVVGLSLNIRPSLAHRDHVQGIVKVSVASHREPVLPYTTSPLEASTGAVPE
jgi:hypothetical protein